MQANLAVCVLVLLATAAPAWSQPADRWGPLRPFFGTWEGTSSGQPGRGTVRREYRLTLGDRFIEVLNTSTYPPQEKNPKGEVHEDRGYISVDTARKQFVFRQFHVEGFVNTYAAAPEGPPIVFTSEALENIPPGWRARETWRLEPGGELVEVFELAEPGKEFAVYSETRLHRVK
jgi:THAP4-like, heme-binding beta-barrel domain